jgi:predicted metallo-beta-lactamase superfamily hydrolase
LKDKANEPNGRRKFARRVWTLELNAVKNAAHVIVEVKHHAYDHHKPQERKLHAMCCHLFSSLVKDVLKKIVCFRSLLLCFSLIA